MIYIIGSWKSLWNTCCLLKLVLECAHWVPSRYSFPWFFFRRWLFFTGLLLSQTWWRCFTSQLSLSCRGELAFSSWIVEGSKLLCSWRQSWSWFFNLSFLAGKPPLIFVLTCRFLQGSLSTGGCFGPIFRDFCHWRPLKGRLQATLSWERVLDILNLSDSGSRRSSTQICGASSDFANALVLALWTLVGILCSGDFTHWLFSILGWYFTWTKKEFNIKNLYKYYKFLSSLFWKHFL